MVTLLHEAAHCMRYQYMLQYHAVSDIPRTPSNMEHTVMSPNLPEAGFTLEQYMFNGLPRQHNKHAGKPALLLLSFR